VTVAALIGCTVMSAGPANAVSGSGPMPIINADPCVSSQIATGQECTPGTPSATCVSDVPLEDLGPGTSGSYVVVCKCESAATPARLTLIPQAQWKCDIVDWIIRYHGVTLVPTG
jgi:hypothetical protein